MELNKGQALIFSNIPWSGLFTTDIAVTFFEGKATDIVFNIITGLVSEDKLFSIDFVSCKFSSFEYSQIDQKKKPQLFKITSPTNEM